jgi:tRNA A-37 threonylcarbamoyl transferase component Bud32
MGTQIGEMHRRGILHGDLNWRNLLVRRADRDLEFYLVDLDGSRSRKKLGREEAIRDLAHFMRDLGRNKVSAEEQQCFLDHWRHMFG